MSNPTADPTIDSDDEQHADHPDPDSDLDPDSDAGPSADRSPSVPAGGADADRSGTGDGIDLQSSPVRRYLAWGALGVCSLLALFALVQFYGSVTDAIDIWVEPRHQPLMRAAFNLVVLLASLVGVSLVVRELS